MIIAYPYVISEDGRTLKAKALDFDLSIEETMTDEIFNDEFRRNEFVFEFKLTRSRDKLGELIQNECLKAVKNLTDFKIPSIIAKSDNRNIFYCQVRAFSLKNLSMTVDNQDIIITDPCYIISKENENDWALSKYGSKMEELGITDYMVMDTFSGDWSCSTYSSEIGADGVLKLLGEFCADAGMVSVFKLDDVLKYNPAFDAHISRSWTTTLIKNFTGKVRFDIVETIDEDDCASEEVRVIGEDKDGRQVFFTTQLYS